jgi:hypothetical protein
MCLATLTPLLLATSARADGTPASSVASAPMLALAQQHTPCDDNEIENPFAAWSDDADYFLNTQGDVSSGGNQWTLDGATIAEQDNAYTTYPGDPAPASVSLTEDQSATAPTTCVTVDDPSMRFFVRNTGSETGTLRVDVLYTNENFEPATLTLGTLTSADAGDAWTPSPVIMLSAPLVALLTDDYTPVRFKFTAEGEGSSWLVDDVYVDPYGKG